MKQPITADQIAGELGVSVRTVYRYIDDLSVSGIPIYGTAGVGYQLHEDFELPPLNLTEKEIDALASVGWVELGCRNKPYISAIFFPLFGFQFHQKKLGVFYALYRVCFLAPSFPIHCERFGLELLQLLCH